jgi:RNA polymerase sigma-70 factor (ECF subfamily)
VPYLPTTHVSLLARLVDPHDEAAWSEFLTVYESAVYRYARSRGLQDSDARDVVQNVVVAVHSKVASWVPNNQKGSFRSWLLRTSHYVAMNTLRSLRRADGNAVSYDVDEIAGQLENESLDWERWAFSWAAEIVKGEVVEATWRAFHLTAVDGKSAAEVANLLGIRQGSVYTAKCRVMARIKELVSQLSRAES